MQILLDIAREWGPFVTVVAFVIWRDWKRELRLTNHIVTLESEMREVILPIVKNSTEVVSQNTEVLKRVEGHLNVGQPYPQPAHQANALQPQA